MVNQQLLDYVKKELARGVSENSIRQILLEHNWPEFEINEAFEQVKESTPPQKPDLNEQESEEPLEEEPEELVEEPVKEEKVMIETPKLDVAGKDNQALQSPPVINDVKKILTNKIFIIAAIIIVLGSVAFFTLPSILGGDDSADSGATDVSQAAKDQCKVWCTAKLCGRFTAKNEQGKSCVDMQIECPNCEVPY